MKKALEHREETESSLRTASREWQRAADAPQEMAYAKDVLNKAVDASHKVFYGEHMKVDSQVRKHFQDNVQPLKDIRDARLRPEAKEDKGKEKGFFKNNFEYDEW